MLIHESTKVVILAAGDGTRMKSDLPKVMHLLNGKPLLEYVVSAVEQTELGKPTIVVSGKHKLVQEYLGERAEYVVQTEQLGTGHAVAAVLPQCGTSERIVVLYGDMPFVSPGTITSLANTQQKDNCAVALATATVPNFKDWRNALADFGRIVRDHRGQVIKIVEVKDASASERAILEINPAYFCFRRNWAEQALRELTTNNSQKEYYLTDLVASAIKQGEKICTISINACEAIGINTIDGLVKANDIFSQSLRI